MLEGTTDERQLGKLTRAWRVNEIGNKLSTLQHKRDGFLRRLKECTRDCEAAHARFEENEAKHANCTWNCSVQRSKPFYDKRKAHEENVDKQLHELEVMSQDITKLREEFNAMTPEGEAAPEGDDEGAEDDVDDGEDEEEGDDGSPEAIIKSRASQGQLALGDFYIDAAKGGDAEDDFFSADSDSD